MFVSIALRMRVEVEALNMVEALGGYNRHRTVSIFKKVRTGSGGVKYKIVTAPAISGSSIAHGYHRVLVNLAQRMGLPVCDECNRDYEIRGGFQKRATAVGKTHDDRLKECVIEDLTGFLAIAEAAGAGPRRTSPVSFSYLVPDAESAIPALDPQFHVRYDFETNEHRPFTIESGSAIYMLSASIDIDRIGKLENGDYVSDRDKRIELALRGLSVLIEGFSYGAKKSRYLPMSEILGGIAALSDPIPFMVSPPRVYGGGDNYISRTLKRAEAYVNALNSVGVDEKIYMVFIDKEGIAPAELISASQTTQVEQRVQVERVETVVEMIEKLLGMIKNQMRSSKG